MKVVINKRINMLDVTLYIDEVSNGFIASILSSSEIDDGRRETKVIGMNLHDVLSNVENILTLLSTEKKAQ